ncbi:MAG: hypothetical protein ACPGWQ_01015, partial [Poseidonia sp.]
MAGGIMVALDGEGRVKGVIGQRQLIKALSEGVDASSAQCHEHMEMDFMQVSLSDSLKGVLDDIRKRSPQAVVAVDEAGEFVGYFSPNDYQEAVQ